MPSSQVSKQFWKYSKFMFYYYLFLHPHPQNVSKLDDILLVSYFENKYYSRLTFFLIFNVLLLLLSLGHEIMSDFYLLPSEVYEFCN